MAFLGKGAVLQLQISSVYTTVADIVSIDGPSASIEAVDATHLGSTAHEFLPGLPDWGEVSFTGNYDPSDSTHTALTDLIATPAVANWKVIFADGDSTTYAFAGLLTGFSVKGIENESVVQFEGKIKVSGAVTVS